MSFLKFFLRNRFALAATALLAIATIFTVDAYVEAGIYIDHELARLQRDGDPTEVRQLRNGVNLGGLNAAPLYDAAVAVCAGPFETPMIEASAATLDRSLEACRRDIASHASVFPLLAEAYTRPSCVFPVLPMEGICRQHPNYFALRHLAQLAGVKAMLDVREHRYVEALATTSHMLRLEARWQRNYGYIDEMMVVACMHFTLEPLEAMVSGGVHADYGPVLNDLAVARGTCSERFGRELIDIERVNALSVYNAENLAAAVAAFNPSFDDWGTWVTKRAWDVVPQVISRLDERNYLQAIAEQERIFADLRLDVNTAAWTDEQLQARRAVACSMRVTPPTWALLSRCLLVDFGHGFVCVDKMLHRIDCLEVRLRAL